MARPEGNRLSVRRSSGSAGTSGTGSSDSRGSEGRESSGRGVGGFLARLFRRRRRDEPEAPHLNGVPSNSRSETTHSDELHSEYSLDSV